jgi:hypothetical protein
LAIMMLPQYMPCKKHAVSMSVVAQAARGCLAVDSPLVTNDQAYCGLCSIMT